MRDYITEKAPAMPADERAQRDEFQALLAATDRYFSGYNMPDDAQAIYCYETVSTEAWLHYYGFEPDDGGCITVYKAVNDENRSDKGMTYTVGAIIECDDWRDDNQCGGGLHFCATPFQTHKYTNGRKYLACKVEVSKLKVIPPDKIKAPICFVEREVNIAADPV